MIPGRESSWADSYSHYSALNLSGKLQPILAGPGLCIFPSECVPAQQKQPGSCPCPTPSPDPGAGSTAGAQRRMTSRQISHGLSLLVLLLLLIKARLVGISRALCGVPLLQMHARSWLEVFGNNPRTGESFSLIASMEKPRKGLKSWILSQPQRSAITLS